VTDSEILLLLSAASSVFLMDMKAAADDLKKSGAITDGIRFVVYLGLVIMCAVTIFARSFGS
jgi:hypothetical protein